MPYLNLDSNYFDHVKTKRLVARLGYGSESIPIKLWCYCAAHYPDTGVLPNHSAQEIASLIGYQGDAKAMLQALLDLEIAFLTPQNGIGIHEWNEHQGHIVSFHIRAKVANKARWDKYYSRRESATSTAKVETSKATRNPPNLTIPNHTKQKNIFIPPTVDQVREYCFERKNNIDPQYFVDSGIKNGWVDKNGNKYKDWKAVVRVWEKFSKQQESNGYGV